MSSSGGTRPAGAAGSAPAAAAARARRRRGTSDLPVLPPAAVPQRARLVPLPPMSYFAKITITVVVVLGLIVLTYKVRSVLLSVFLGLFLAVGFEPVIRWLVRRGLRRGLAVLVLFVSFAVVLGGIGTVLVQPALAQGRELISALPDVADNVLNQLRRAGIKVDTNQISKWAGDLAKELPKILSTSVGSLSAVLGAIAAAVFNVVTVVALSAYFMLALPRLRRAGEHMLGTRDRALVMSQALDKVGGYVSGQLTLCFLAGLVTTLALTVFGVPYAAVIGLIVGLFDALPQVGASIAAVLGTLIALSDGWKPALVTLVVILAYQQVENYVISPRIFSQAVNLSPLAVFVAVLVGGGLAGAVGALVALPVTAAAKVVLAYAFRLRRRRRDLLTALPADRTGSG